MKIWMILFFWSQVVFAQSENFVYDPTGQRDPFFPSRKVSGVTDTKLNGDKVSEDQSKQSIATGDPLLLYTLAEYKLMAILWDVKNPKALVLAPNGKVYTLLNKSKLGREGGTVATIQEQEVRFQVPSEDGDAKKIETRVIYLRH